MSDRMTPVSFPEMLTRLTQEYRNYGTFCGVPVIREAIKLLIGPAAGPHTQLAGNIVAAYAAGATCYELKTVQILEGEELNIKKPCIYVGHEVYNTEWSTELTAEQAGNEYIKAYLLIKVLSREFNLREAGNLHFIISVGYDYEGIRSPKIDAFLNNMLRASGTGEWQEDIAYLKEHVHEFQNLTLEDIRRIEEADVISDTAALSTMHGCESSQIAKIAVYLIEEKGLNTFIKLNPTLAGREEIRKLFDKKGYHGIDYPEEIFDKDIDLDTAVRIIRSCKEAADRRKKIFGVKMTNTFPVRAGKQKPNGEKLNAEKLNTEKLNTEKLNAEEMYLSGPALYPIALRAASLLAEHLGEDIPISYSGGADDTNILDLFAAGLHSVTVSSMLLKPGGYKNLSRLVKRCIGLRYNQPAGDEGNRIKAYDEDDKENKGNKGNEENKGNKKEHTAGSAVNIEKLRQLSQEAIRDKHYNYAPPRHYELKQPYDNLCARCSNCTDVCPNRANIRLETGAGRYVIHRDRLCNECGCCVFSCIMGHNPYREKLTLFETEEAYMESGNDGVLYTGDVLRYRRNGAEEPVPGYVKELIFTARERGKL